MATLKTILHCVAAGQLLVATKDGLGTVQGLSLIGDREDFLVDLGGEMKYFEPRNLTPILAGFQAFRAAALRGDQVPVMALQMIADAVANVRVVGRHLRPLPAAAQGLVAALPNGKGAGRFSWELAAMWNPTGVEEAKGHDARQWQPVAVPGLNDFLLSHGYAAGIPAGEWITEDGAPVIFSPITPSSN